MDLPIFDAWKGYNKKSLSGELQNTPPLEMDT